MAASANEIISKGFPLLIVLIATVYAQICQPLQAPSNGMTSCSTIGDNLYCKATCSAGYAFTTGDFTITKVCSNVQGGWQGESTLPKCELVSTKAPPDPTNCIPLKSPSNGIVSCSGNGLAVTCKATCKTGYIFITGQKSISKTCSDVTGGWEGGDSLPECTANQCNAPLLSSVNDSRITASSVWSGVHVYYFGPERARMDSDVKTSGSLVLAGGWRPATNSLDQYIQVELNSVTRITGIATAGRVVLAGDTAREYVTRYRLLYSTDGNTWQSYNSETVNDQFLDGNTDNVMPKINRLNCPFDARYVRINPLAWNENIALRFELYGCPPDGTKPVCKSSVPTPAATQRPNTTPTTTIAVPPQNLCHAIPPPTNGVVNCEQSGTQTVCVASCRDGYIFETKESLIKRVCETATGVWPKGQIIPACIKSTQTTPRPPPHGCLTAESNCNKIGNGDFQACGGCHYFSTCSEGFLYIRACPERLLFDAVSNVCDYHSRTCPSP